MIGAIRYVDDLQAFIAIDSTKIVSKELAESIIHTLQENTYHPDLKLKAENTSGKWAYLEAHLEIKATQGQSDKISITYNNKNLAPLLEDGKLKFMTLQHRESFMTKQQACAKIIGQLHRIDKTVADNKSKMIATLEFMLIAQANGYQPKLIAQCAVRVFLKTDKKIWHSISKCILKLTRYWI